jgi:hypothetical protein
VHAFGCNKFAGDLVDFISPASDYYYFKTVVFIQVDVQTGVYVNFGFVLHIRQKVAQSVYSVVIHQGDDADNVRIAPTDFFLDQVIANQIANCL